MSGKRKTSISTTLIVAPSQFAHTCRVEVVQRAQIKAFLCCHITREATAKVPQCSVRVADVTARNTRSFSFFGEEEASILIHANVRGSCVCVLPVKQRADREAVVNTTDSLT